MKYHLYEKSNKCCLWPFVGEPLPRDAGSQDEPEQDHVSASERRILAFIWRGDI